MKLTFNQIILGFIIVIAIFFRFYNLSSVPPQATLDEVSIGYNAYSILKTGADEYGTRLPVLLRAYDDWRPALYVYLVIPFVSFFGLDVASVRLPSVTLSVLSVVAVYFLIKLLAKEAKSFSFGKQKLDIPLLSAFLFAISPWHIYLSRLGHEVNASFSFLIFGLLFFFHFLEGKRWGIYLCAIFFGFSFYSYQSGKIIIPILVLALMGLYLRKIARNKIHFVLSGLIGFLIILPVLLSSFDDNALIRFKGTSLVGNSPAYFQKVSDRYLVDKIEKDLGFVFDNKKIATVLLISNAHLSHYDPVWLFLNEDDGAFKAPGMGLLYLFELPLIFFALLFILRSGINNKVIIFILVWGVVAVIPGSLTTGYPHAMRAVSLLPVPQLLAAIGLISLLVLLKNKKLQHIVILSFVGISFISTLWFSHAYFTLLPRELSTQFQFGAIDALREARKYEDNYKEIFVSNKDGLSQSYMFYLFDTKYDPFKYQSNGGTVSAGYDAPHRIDKYTFKNAEDKLIKNRLYVMNLIEYQNLKKYYSNSDGKTVPSITLNVLSKIYLMNGKTGFVVVETK